jgi:hypothetical protein
MQRYVLRIFLRHNTNKKPSLFNDGFQYFYNNIMV